MPAAESLAPAPAQMPAEPVAAAVSPAAAEPPAEAPAETPAEAPVEAPAAEHAAIAPENTAALYSSEEPDDPASQDAPSIYTVTVYYVFFDTGLTAAEPKSMNVGADGVMQASITFPTVQGYLPYVMNNGKLEYATFYHPEKVGSDVELTVYYQPTDVEYTVEIYQQNVSDDAYTLVDKKTYQAKTGSLVPQFAELPENDSNRISYPGFYPLLNEMPTVAADGSTVVELKFDRDYYLMNFDLNGGYGVEPIYARFGVPISIGTPIRPGYSFLHWNDADNNQVAIPGTMPVNGGTFYAQWKSFNSSYSISYWTVNDDGTRTLIGSRIESGTTNDLVSGRDDLNSSVICGNETVHIHKAECYSCRNLAHQHTEACFASYESNEPGSNGRAVISALGGNEPESGYIYVIYVHGNGKYWPKLYVGDSSGNGTYYAVNGIGGSEDAGSYSSIIEGEPLKTATMEFSSETLTVTKYKAKTACGQQQHVHTADCSLVCSQHVHDANKCYEDTTYLKYADTVTVTKADGTTVTYATDKNVAVKGDGTTVVNVYYQYKQYTLKFYYARTTGGTATDTDRDASTYDSIQVVGGSTWNFGTNDVPGPEDGPQLANVGGWGNVDELPGLNASGQGNSYNPGTLTYNGYSYHYISFTARYGDNIANLWPCGVFNSVTRTTANTHGYWSGKEAFVSAWNGEHRVKYTQDNTNETIKGKYERLDENLLFDLSKFADSSEVSYLCFWENGADISWSVPELYRYNIYLEVYSGQDLTGKTTATHNGKTYYLSDSYDTVDDSDVSKQTQVSLMGYSAAGYTSSALKDYDKSLYNEAYEMNFFYDALEHRLNFWNHNQFLKDGSGSWVNYGEPLAKYFNGITVNGTLYEGANDLIAKEEYYPSTLEPGAYTFEGWYTSSLFQAETKVDPDTMTMPDSDLTVYAHWIPKIHTVKVYLTEADITGSGAPMYEYAIAHNTLVPEDQRPYNPANGDYAFVGWFYRNADGQETAFDFANMTVRDEMHLYAKWSSNVLKEYTIHFVLEDGTPIAPPVTGSALAGRTKTFDAKGGTDLYAGYQEGYYPLVKSHSIVLDIADDSKNVYSFVYEYREDPVPYTVYYLTKDENGNTVELGRKENKDNRKAVVVENYKPFPHYMPDQFQQTLVVSLTEPEKNYIEFWYTPDTVHAFYTFEYYLQDIPADGAAQPTYTLSTQHSYGNAVEIVGNEKKTFTIPEIDIEGFTLDKTVPDTLVTGTLDAVGDTLDLRLYYKRNQYPYQIQYLEYGTGKKLAEPVTYTGNSCPYYGEYVTAGDSQVADVPGYTLHSVRGCTIRVEASQTNPARNFVYVYYVPINGNLKISKTIDNRSNMALDPDLLFEFVITVPEAVTGTYPVSLDDVPQGSVTVSPEHTLSLSVKDVQSVTISGLPVGYPNPYTYHISETPVPGFQGIFSPGQDVVLENKQTKTVTCTNVYPVCDLVLTKTVKKEYEPDTWDRVDDAFRFSIFSPALVNSRAYTIAGQQCWVSNHTLTLDPISVSAPDVPVSLTIHNLPIGEYTVTEKMVDAVKDAYITTANGVEGSVANVTLSTDNLSDTAEFVNTFKRTTGSLTVTKKITIRDGFELDPDDDAEFTFAVIMPEDLAERHYTNISYTVTGHSTIQSVTPDGNRTFTFALKNGESLTIEGLPVGSYIVKEYPSEGYASSFPKPNADGTVQASVTVETGKTTRLDCVNTFPVHVGNLDLSKTVRNESGLSVKLTDTFSFQIAFKDSGEEVTYPVTYRTYDENGTVANSRTGTLTASKTGENVVLTVALKDGEHAVIERIPEGTCTITETLLPKYTTANNGVTTVTITPDQTLPVTVENVYEPSTLTIVKSGAEAGQVFVYEVTDGNGKVTTVTITGNGSTVIHDLAPGFYTVTQKNNWSWRYTDAPQTVTVPKGNATVTFSGGIPNDKSSWLDGNSGLITNRRGG